jgi:hypothetical protein
VRTLIQELTTFTKQNFDVTNHRVDLAEEGIETLVGDKDLLKGDIDFLQKLKLPRDDFNKLREELKKRYCLY